MELLFLINGTTKRIKTNTFKYYTKFYHSINIKSNKKIIIKTIFGNYIAFKKIIISCFDDFIYYILYQKIWKKINPIFILFTLFELII